MEEKGEQGFADLSCSFMSLSICFAGLGDNTINAIKNYAESLFRWQWELIGCGCVHCSRLGLGLCERHTVQYIPQVRAFSGLVWGFQVINLKEGHG